MHKKSGLIASVLVLLVVIGGLALYALRQVRRRPGPGLASAPSGALVVVAVDMARLRSLPLFARLRTAFGREPQARAALATLRTGCGFDPIDRVDSLTLAIDRTSLASYDSGIVLVTSGRATAPEASRCLDALAFELGLPVPTAAASPTSARVFRLAMAGDTSSPSISVAMTPGGILAASPSMLPRALAALDQRRASADRDPRMRAAVGALGGNPEAYAVVDIRSIRESSASAASEIAAIFRDAMGNPVLVSALAADTLSAGVEATPAGIRAITVVRMQNESIAQTVAPMFVQLLTAASGEFATTMTSAQWGYLRRVAQAQGFEPAVASRVVPLQAAFDVFNGLYDRIRVRADGVAIRVELEIAPRDIATLEAGVGALLECNAVLERTRAQRAALPPTAP